jgi:hypothetical protein
MYEIFLGKWKNDGFNKKTQKKIEKYVLFEPHHLCFCLGLCTKWSVHRHVCIVFSLEQPIAMFSFNHCVISRLGD